jgi:hypothetical protein
MDHDPGGGAESETMNRRDWLKSASALGVGAAMANRLSAAETPAATGKTDVRVEIKRLMLRHTWTTTMSSSAYR